MASVAAGLVLAGSKCDSCLPNLFGFDGDDGCQDCGCDPLGAADLQCDPSGQCVCKEGWRGRSVTGARGDTST